MEEKTNIPVCSICGTQMVTEKKETTLDGSRKLDGSSTLGGYVCPKCHPDLVESK